MPNDLPNTRPIIIKRKKVTAAGRHHGGAWKVAYADFVTAMMAFFLLMWLLNATTESQRKGIADYFAPTVPISPVSGGGDGALSGDSIFVEDTLAQTGSGGEAEKAVAAAQTGLNDDPPPEEAPLADLESRLLARSGESEAADDLLDHILTRVTDEGLVIEVFAREGRPLFESGSDAPTARMRAILAMVGDVIGIVSNSVAIAGHTDAEPFAAAERDNWTLSAARADAARRSLLSAGVETPRIARIVGEADRDLALPSAPTDPRNRRVTITLLRSDR